MEGKKLWDLLVNYNPLDQKEQETQRLRETRVVGGW